MKTEWWYDDATLHYSDQQELVLARLIIRDDGTAQILTSGGEVVEVESEDEASVWLVDEEYRRLEDLIEDFMAEGRPVDPRIKLPTAESGSELLRQMVVDLRPPSISSSDPVNPLPSAGAGTFPPEHIP
jgi:hypothetical protein